MFPKARAAVAALLGLCACSEPPAADANDVVRIVRGPAFQATAAKPETPATAETPAAAEPASLGYDAVTDSLEEASQTVARRADPYRLSDTVLAEGAG